MLHLPVVPDKVVTWNFSPIPKNSVSKTWENGDGLTKSCQFITVNAIVSGKE